MSTSVTGKLARLGLFGTLLAFSLPAMAHIDASHVGHAGQVGQTMGGFGAGLLHPMIGLDHLLAMLAVGMWAAQNKRTSLWILPLAFPLMMVLGACLGSYGFALLEAETWIALSVFLLGCLIAFAVQLPAAASAALIAVFAMAHGYAHGVELPAGVSGVLYGAGFIASTAILHLTGLMASLALQKGLDIRLSRLAGTAISACGVLFLFGLA
ncbi:HupE/UreJ family protein [Undibacterium sp. Ren11W]|uniref:HupE/UreJ family protein n=1 Tax=Undibacterium sp. Ren11W TaxID=3413045 RepID=UPI003BF3081D